MLLDFFTEIRRLGVPVSVREWLDLIQALEQHLVFADMDEFYFLARALLVKDERHFDKFDRAFSTYFSGLPTLNNDLIAAQIPPDWLHPDVMRHFTAAEKAQLQSLGGLDKLLETLKQRFAEQQKKHAGGNKWIGTGGTSPFGSGGFNPEGIRFGEAGQRQGKAVKVWERRDYRNLDAQSEISRRNIQLALRRLRKFARQGAPDELDIDDTIAHTARDAGLLNIRLRPERRNAVKLLVLFDIGGSMDLHVQTCQELFSACQSEFKHLEYFYFHNFIYEALWRDNQQRTRQLTSTLDILHTYGPDWKIVFVGDAAMAPYEINQPGGSVEHWNEEAGETWMQRLTQHYRKLIWLNPQAEEYWPYTRSISMVQQLVQGHMYPLTLNGLEAGMSYLAK